MQRNKSFTVKDEDMTRTRVLFVGGFATGARAWDAVIAALGPSFRTTVCVDRAGSSVSEYADACVRHASEMRWRSFVVVGHSLGALIAMEIAGSHGERVDGLCLLSPPWRGCVSRLMTPRFCRAAWILAWQGRAAAAAYANFRDRDRVRVPPQTEGPPPEGQHRELYSLLTYVRPDATKLRAIARAAGRSVVVVGDSDMFVTVREALDLALELGSETHVIPRSGHLVYVERPAEIARIVRHLCES